jgi:micrococcal nuclease
MAEKMSPYVYKAKILRVVDGDTVDIDLDLGFGVIYAKQRVRLLGIDTPESRTRDLTEKYYGNLAKDFLKSLLVKGKVYSLQTTLDKGKFGRILGDFLIDDDTKIETPEVSVNQIMLDNYHAVKYRGQNKAEVEVEHLENRQKLLEYKGVQIP